MLVVVGGHSRKTGKTSVTAGLIRAIPEARWTAVKISGHGHGVPYAVSEETNASASGDSARYLAAGAARSFWLRASSGSLAAAVPELRGLLAWSPNAIIESNSVIEFLQPDLCLAVVDFRVPDFKDSARRLVQAADALVVVGSGPPAPPWPGISLEGKPRFVVREPEYTNPELVEFVRARLLDRRRESDR